jgi:Anti-sigma-K factor rskA
MTRPTDNPNPIDLAAGYILDDLSPEEAMRLNQALAESPALHGEIAALGEAFALLPYNMPLQAPSAGLKAKILSAATQSIAPTQSITSGRSETIAPSRATPGSNVVSIGSRRRTWQRWIPAISTGIAAVAIATIGLNQVQLSRQSQQTIALQQQLETTNTELANLRRDLKASQNTIAILTQPGAQTYALAGATANPKNGQLATAQIVAKPGERTVMIVATALPKLQTNQIYRLWAATATATKPLYCGQFRQDDSGTAQWNAPNAACTQKPLQLMITLDGPNDPTTAAGPLVMQTLS